MHKQLQNLKQANDSANTATHSQTQVFQYCLRIIPSFAKYFVPEPIAQGKFHSATRFKAMKMYQ